MGHVVDRPKLIEIFGRIDSQQLLDAGKAGGFAKGESAR